MRGAGLISAVVALAVAGCAGVVRLTPAARKVLLVRNEHHRDNMRSLGRVSCDVTLRSAGIDTNAINCENDLLNQAAQLGGTIVVVRDMNVDEDSAVMEAEVFAPDV